MVKSADAGIPTMDNMDVHRRGMARGSQYLRLSGPKPRSSMIYTLPEGWYMGTGQRTVPQRSGKTLLAGFALSESPPPSQLMAFLVE